MTQYYEDEEGNVFRIDDEGSEIIVDPESGEELWWRDPETGETGEMVDESESENGDLAGRIEAAEQVLGRRLLDSEVESFVIDHEAGRPIGLTEEEGYLNIDDQGARRDYLRERLAEGEYAERGRQRELAADARGTFDESESEEAEGEVESE